MQSSLSHLLPRFFRKRRIEALAKEQQIGEILKITDLIEKNLNEVQIVFGD